MTLSFSLATVFKGGESPAPGSGAESLGATLAVNDSIKRAGAGINAQLPAEGGVTEAQRLAAVAKPAERSKA